MRYPWQWQHFRTIHIFIFNNDQLPVLCMFFFQGLFTASLCSVLWQSGLRLNFTNWIACVIACWILLSTCSCMTNVAVFYKTPEGLVDSGITLIMDIRDLWYLSFKTNFGRVEYVVTGPWLQWFVDYYYFAYAWVYQGLLLLTRFSINPSMDK